MPLVGRTWVKTGDKHGLAEASTMRWVARHTSIPVPRVICALEHKSGRTSIVMEAVAGRPLWETWDKRSPESKQRILAQLKCMVDEMRALPPAARFETVDGGPLYGGSLCSWNETYPAMYGPCESFHTLHHQLQRNIYHHEDAANDEALDAEERENPNSENGPPNVAPQYSDDATCPPPVFTHGRLTPFNIWADRDTVTGIIQWQNAGWWPDYWEYANCMSSLAHIFAPEWASEKDQFLAPFPEGEAMEKERQNWYTPCCCSC
jgi:aminoglycoside phosphotransferase